MRKIVKFEVIQYGVCRCPYSEHKYQILSLIAL